jgi:hypothetical protein
MVPGLDDGHGAALCDQLQLATTTVRQALDDVGKMRSPTPTFDMDATSCAASTSLAISISLRAAVSGPTVGWLQRISSCL